MGTAELTTTSTAASTESDKHICAGRHACRSETSESIHCSRGPICADTVKLQGELGSFGPGLKRVFTPANREQHKQSIPSRGLLLPLSGLSSDAWKPGCGSGPGTMDAYSTLNHFSSVCCDPYDC
ncbi:uncharacterized protein LOC144991963 [Oryzias latipes]